MQSYHHAEKNKVFGFFLHIGGFILLSPQVNEDGQNTLPFSSTQITQSKHASLPQINQLKQTHSKNFLHNIL